MKALLNFLFRLTLKYWFPLLLAGIAFYVIYQKEVRIVLYFQKPTDEVPSQEMQAADEYAEHSSKKSTEENRLHLLSWGKPASRQTEQLDLQQALQEISKEQQLQYLKRFARVAVAERKKFGLPSSVILAMALLHSTAGQADPAREANNHFGLLCTDFREGKDMEINGRCYRAYENAWSSFRDFSIFVTQSVSGGTAPSPTDHYNWAKRLEEMKISPVPQLSAKLEQIIKTFQLYELDLK